MLWLILLAARPLPAGAVITAAQSQVTYTGTPTQYFTPAQASNQAAANAQAQMQQMMQQIGQMLQSSNVNAGPKDWAAGGGDTPRGDAPPAANTDYDKYSYPDDYTYSSGSKGLKGIGNGLCISDPKKPRPQVTAGYCDLLRDALLKDGSCANREVKAIINQAGQTGAGVGDLPKYCSRWPNIKDDTQKIMVFEQILAALITRESGWNSKATEKAWGGAGNFHQGKGLFQIGTWYSARDPDCNGLNDSNIYDPATNIKCGACVALSDLAKDMTMGNGVGDSGARGMARTFGPFRDGQSAIRSSIQAATNNYCSTRVGDGGSGSGSGDSTTQGAAQ